MVKNPQNPINVHSLWISPVLWSTLRQTLFIGTDGYAAALNQPKSYYQSVRAFFFVGHMLNDSDFIAYNTDRRFQKIEHSSRARPKMCMGVWRGNGGNGGKRKAARPPNDERKRATILLKAVSYKNDLSFWYALQISLFLHQWNLLFRVP